MTTPGERGVPWSPVFIERSTSGGTLECPICGHENTNDNSFRKHVRDRHQCTVSFRAQRTEVQRHQARRGRDLAYREVRRAAASMQRLVSKREHLFTTTDAVARGGQASGDPIVEYRASRIEGAGNGVFACVPLRVGDVVTRYEGSVVAIVTANPEYTIQLRGSPGFIDGIRTPIAGKGLGSFVNREDRSNTPSARKNCEFVEDDGIVYLTVTRSIKAGYELYTTYSRGYRIKKE